MCLRLYIHVPSHEPIIKSNRKLYYWRKTKKMLTTKHFKPCKESMWNIYSRLIPMHLPI